MASLFGRRHHTFFAEEIRKGWPRESLADYFVSIFAKDSKTFKLESFWRDCGLSIYFCIRKRYGSSQLVLERHPGIQPIYFPDLEKERFYATLSSEEKSDLNLFKEIRICEKDSRASDLTFLWFGEGKLV